MELEDVVAGAVELGIYELLRQRLVVPKPVASPAAGAEWALSVPSQTTWEVLSVEETFATSAVVANRAANLVVKDPNGVKLGRFAPSAVMAAGASFDVTFWGGLGAALAVSHLQAPLTDPPVVLREGWSIGSLTTNIDVGDQYSGIVLVVREWTTDAVERNIEWLGEALR